RAHDVLGGRTGNEAAETPNLDRLCADGSCGVLYAVGPGRAPSSEVAHWSMLGYTPAEFPGRAVFEALGRGQEVSPEHVLVHEAERTARAAEAWTREVMRRLEGERFNVVTLKWWGRWRDYPSFLERHGVGGSFVAESAFLRGLGAALGLDPIHAPEGDDPVA